MKKIDSFINQYSLLKTLRFKLVPIGKTSENFISKKLLELDVRRAELYEKVKGYMDEYHRYFIDNAFDSSCGVDVCAYADLYFKGNKSNKEKEQLKKEAENLRKEIAKILTSHKDYGKLFSKEMVTEVLPSTLSEVEKLNDTAEFNNFYTYFKGFNENRKNIYTSEEKSTGIAYRCINDNLPKYLDNAKTFLTVWEALSPENKEKLHTSFYGLISGTIEQMFEVNKFYAVISQKGIAAYNNLIGGYTLENGEKIQGLNEYINLHNQTVDKNHRLPVLKMLFKQILSDRESVSFIPEKFENDNAVLKAINDYWNAVQTIVTEDLTELFADIAGRGIYIKNGLAVSDISQKLTSSWNTVKSEWEKEYDAEFTKKKNDKYEENRENEWKKIASFSLENLQHYIGEKSVIEYCKEALSQKIETVINAYGKAKELLVSDYSNKRKSLAKNDSDIEVIKNFLDSIKDLEHFLEVFKGDGTEEDKNELFYGSFSKCLFEISLIDRLYDKVRNYITQKPYSTDKIKLNFENPVFLSGWPKGNEFANSSQIFRRNGIYYLAVMDKTLKNNLPKEYAKSDSADDEFEKMEYFVFGAHIPLPYYIYAYAREDKKRRKSAFFVSL